MVEPILASRSIASMASSWAVIMLVAISLSSGLEEETAIYFIMSRAQSARDIIALIAMSFMGVAPLLDGVGHFVRLFNQVVIFHSISAHSIVFYE
jgi:hypothetical protein